MSSDGPLTRSGFTPTEQDVAALMEWFARYDAYVRNGDTQAMAEAALFPITVITNDSAGNCVSQEWDHETFVQAMSTTAEGTDLSDAEIANRREPVFLDRDLAVVVTDSTVTAGGRAQHMRYVDIMVKQDGGWRFKSMIQAGWGGMLREHLGA
jgi:hypothetical protein